MPADVPHRCQVRVRVRLTDAGRRDCNRAEQILATSEGTIRIYIDRGFAERAFQAIANVKIDSPSALIEP